MVQSTSFKLGESPSRISTSSRDELQSLTTTSLNNDSRQDKFQKILDLPSETLITQKPRRPEKSDFSKSFGSSVENLKSTGHAALAVGGTLLGFDEFAKSEIKEAERNQNKADRLARGLILDLNDVETDKGIGEGLGDLGDYLINGAGTLAPSILESIVTGIAGAAIGSSIPGAGTVAGGIAGGLGKTVAKKRIQSVLKEYIATKGYKVGVTQSAITARKKKLAESTFRKFYATAANTASSSIQGIGETFLEAKEAGATTSEATEQGLVFGVPLGLLDNILPSSIINDIGGKSISGVAGRAIKEGAKGFVTEGATELAQEEILLRTKQKFDDEFDIGGEEAQSRRLNSFVLGGLGGTAFGALAGATTQSKLDLKNIKTPISNTDFRNKEVASIYNKINSFIKAKERYLGFIGNTDVDQNQVKQILTSLDEDILLLNNDITSKYLNDENKDLNGKAEAKEVKTVIDTYLSDSQNVQDQISEIDTSEKITQQRAENSKGSNINPEYKHTEGIKARVLGLAESQDIELTIPELNQITNLTQSRLFSLEDQSLDANSAISSLKRVIQEDLKSIQINKDNILEDIASRSKVSQQQLADENITDTPVINLENGVLKTIRNRNPKTKLSSDVVPKSSTQLKIEKVIGVSDEDNLKIDSSRLLRKTNKQLSDTETKILEQGDTVPLEQALNKISLDNSKKSKDTSFLIDSSRENININNIKNLPVKIRNLSETDKSNLSVRFEETLTNNKTKVNTTLSNGEVVSFSVPTKLISSNRVISKKPKISEKSIVQDALKVIEEASASDQSISSIINTALNNVFLASEVDKTISPLSGTLNEASVAIIRDTLSNEIVNGDHTDKTKKTLSKILDDTSSIKPLRSKSVSKIKTERQNNRLVKSGNTRKTLVDSEVKPIPNRLRNTESVVSVGDLGLVNLEGLKGRSGNVNVEILSSTAKNLRVKEPGQSSLPFTVSKKRFTRTGKQTSIEDLQVVQVSLEDRVKEKLTPKSYDDINTEIEGIDIPLEQKLDGINKEIISKRKETDKVTLTDDQIDTIDKLQEQINTKLDIISTLDTEIDQEEIRQLRSEIKQLSFDKKQTSKTNKREIVSQSLILEDKNSSVQNTLGSESNEYLTSSDVNSVLKGREPTSSEKSSISKIVSKVSDNLIDQNIGVHYITSREQYVKLREQMNLPRLSDTSLDLDQWKGLSVLHNSRHHVFLNGTTVHLPENAAQTLMHELVGHVGIKRLFGDKVDVYFNAVLSSNPALRNDILSLSKKWKNYNSAFERDNPNITLNKNNSYSFKDPSTGKVTLLHKKVSTRLAEEYFAELAAIKITDPTFKVKDKLRNNFVDRTLKKLVHFLRTVFGSFSSQINEEDLLSAVAASANTIFKNNESFMFMGDLRPKVNMALANKRGEVLNLDAGGRLRIAANTGEGIEVLQDGNIDNFQVNFQNILPEVSMDTNEEAVGVQSALDMGVSSKINNGVRNALASGYGKLNESSRINFVNNVERQLRQNSFTRKFFSLGNLNHRDLYNATQSVTKGKLGLLENFSKKINKQLSNLTEFQSQEVYKYFTTKLNESQNIEALETLTAHGVPKQTRNTIIEAKSTIESLGQQLSDLGLLDQDTFEENKGSYLPKRYLKYLFNNPGVGKKTSFLNFLKKDNNLDANTRGMLGEIKDPAFLVAETVAMIGRDVSLLQMFDSLAQSGVSGNTSWVLNSEDFIRFRGKSRSLDWIQREKDRVEVILKDHLSDRSGAFQLSETQLNFNRKLIEDLTVAESDGESAMLDRLRTEAEISGLSDISPVDYRDKFYSKLPKTKRMGRLSGLWVRKEIKNDLQDVLQSFDIDPDDVITQWFGGKGKLVKANSYWKMLKVPFNLPSWFRNAGGNLTLLDISTTTSLPKLINMYKQEVTQATKGKESIFWNLAVENGLFGTTYAASEIYGLQRDLSSKLKNAAKIEELVKDSPVKAMFHGMNEEFLTISDKLGTLFGYMEGSFKTVAMRDHIQQWEKQNNQKFSEITDPDRKQALIFNAVEHANTALFDYSQVPGFVQFARRYPLGAPFITFMYKSFPVVIQSLAKRPQKFAKYVATPMIMSMLAQGMNDWDDEDMERLEASLPIWTKDKSSLMIIPFKDSSGRPQFFDYSYATPWSPFIDAGLKIANHQEEEGIVGSVVSTLTSGSDVADDFGFLGGPLPSLISAWKNNKDSFSGRTIVNPGDLPSQKFSSMTTWLWNMSMPSFITSHGFLGRLYNQLNLEIPPFGIPEPLDRDGDIRNTPGQVLGNLSGFGTSGFDPKNTVRANLRNFNRRLSEVKKSRANFIRNPNNRNNPEVLAKAVREFTAKQKLIINERKEFLERVR